MFTFGFLYTRDISCWLIFTWKTVAKTVCKNHYIYCKLHTTFPNYKSIWRVFIWEQILLDRWINKWIVTQLHNSRNICIILTTAFPIPRCKLLQRGFPWGLGRDQRAHSKTMQDVEQVLLQQSIWLLANSSLYSQALQRMLKESPCKFRQTVSGFAEDLVITNCLRNYFYIFFFLATKISAYLKWNLCLYL